MLDRIIICPRHIRPFLNRERRRAERVILDSDGILARGASARGLVAGPGLGLDDDVHPAITTGAPAITTIAKMRCSFILSHKQSACRFRLLCYALFV